jgi:DNA-binding transcriptional ArsR family regulator
MDTTVVEESAVAHAALSPLRLRILRHLDAPASASELARSMEVPRQKLTYHLNVLERHGLVELDEERRRRGFVERRFRRSGSVVLAPDLVEPVPEMSDRDALSADAVVAAATDAIRAIGRLAPAAAASGASLPTATLTTQIAFATPGDLRSFLADVADLAARYDAGSRPGGRAMTLTVLSHPAVSPEPRSDP